MWRVLVVLTVAMATACKPPLPPQFAGAREKVEVESGYVLVTATADGKKLRFVVDTGASITSVTPAAAKRIGVVPNGKTQVGGTVVTTGMLGRLAIANIAHAGVRVAILEKAEARRLHARVDGILGLDVLSQHDIVIDFRRRELVLLVPGALAASPAAQKMARCELAHGPYGLILLDVGFEDLASRIPAVLDLGAPVSYFNHAAARMFGKDRSSMRPQFWVVHPPELDVGTVRMQQSWALVQDLSLFRRIGHANTPAMLLGSDVFEDRALAIGYRDRIAFVSR